MTYYAVVRNDKHLEHHGIKGQKWGVRRFQNSDGSLTPAGRERYGSEEGSPNSDGSYKVQRSNGKAPNGRFEDKFKEDWDVSENQDEINRYAKLMKEVEHNSWDWYNDKAKSPAQKKLEAERKKVTASELKKFDKENAEEKKRVDGSWAAIEKEYQDRQDKAVEKARKFTPKFLQTESWEKEIRRNARYAMGNDMSYLKRRDKVWDERHAFYNKRDAVKESVKDKYDEKMLGQVLKDLGYEDTLKGRDRIRNVVFWD